MKHFHWKNASVVTTFSTFLKRDIDLKIKNYAYFKAPTKGMSYKILELSINLIFSEYLKAKTLFLQFLFL